MALYGTKEADHRQNLWIGGSIDYQQLIRPNKDVRKLTEWIIFSGRLGRFSLAKRLLCS